MEITKEEYQSWRHHPVTKVFLQYVRDFREQATQGALNDWLSGGRSFAEVSDVVRGQIHLLRDIEELEFASIEEFYKEIADSNGTETDQDGTRRVSSGEV